MGNIIRLTGGGQIQVRTGVLQGIGPSGPRGLIGPRGVDGGQGPEGPAGPIGQILQQQSKTIVGGTTPLVPNTQALVSFGSVAYDDMGIIASSTNFIFNTPGDYLFYLSLVFGSSGSSTGYREVHLTSNINGSVGAAQVAAVTTTATILTISAPFRTTVANEQIQVFASSTEAAGITGGSAVICRIGSGPVGPVGPVGPQGPVGPVGPTGPQGPAGNANSGFNTYADLV